MTSRQKFYNQVNKLSQVSLGQLIELAGSVENLMNYLHHEEVFGERGITLCLIQETIDGEPDEDEAIWDGMIEVVNNHFEYVGYDQPGGGSHIQSKAVRIERCSTFYVC